MVPGGLSPGAVPVTGEAPAPSSGALGDTSDHADEPGPRPLGFALRRDHRDAGRGRRGVVRTGALPVVPALHGHRGGLTAGDGCPARLTPTGLPVGGYRDDPGLPAHLDVQ